MLRRDRSLDRDRPRIAAIPLERRRLEAEEASAIIESLVREIRIAPARKDEAIRLTPPRRMTLEQGSACSREEELVEVTPRSIRLRKRYLDPHQRKRQARRPEAA